MTLADWLTLIGATIIACFGFVLLFGAPYLPTLTPQVDIALDLLNLKPGDTLIELGSGDGKVLLAATRRGLRVTGYELNPILVVISRIRTCRYRDSVTIVWGNFWNKEWPSAEGIFSFVLKKQMPKLDSRIQTTCGKPTLLACFGAPIPSKKPKQKRQGVYLYLYTPNSKNTKS